MTVDDFRGQVNQLVADWAASYANPALGIALGSVPVFYENGPEPDAATARLWVDVEIRFYSSNLIALGESDGRHTGAISTAVFIKDGEGTQIPDALLRDLTKLLRRRRFGTGAYTKYPERTTPPTPSFFGWFRSGLLTPFVLHENAT